MAPSDIPAVLGIMEPLAEAGVLVKRTAAELGGRLDEFAVYEVDGTIHACGGLHLFPDRTGEICGVAVDDSYENMGTGRRMVAWLMNRAAQAKCRKVFLLTTRASDWFYSIGFKKGTLKDLPKEKRAGYDVRRNSLILVCALPGRRLHGGLRME